MIDIIFAVKFVHVLAAAAMFGTWLAIVLFMVLANRSANTSVVALTSQFVVRVEMIVMIAAIAVPPISGFPLAAIIGVSSDDDFWIVLSLALYGLVVLAWLIEVRLEVRIRNMTREASLASTPLPDAYRRLFRIWLVLALPILASMIGLFLLMVWQPRLE